MIAAPLAGPAAPLVATFGLSLSAIFGLNTVFWGAHFVGIEGAVPIQDPEILRRTHYIDILRIFQKIMEKTSPQQAEIMKSRLQSLIPDTGYPSLEVFSSPKNRPVLDDFNLNGFLQYLQHRYAEISMCIPSLLDPTFSPLREALQGCNQLPGSP
jgi:hypothetical protein